MNRRVPNGTHGGVEGGLITRPSDDFEELLRGDVLAGICMFSEARMLKV